MQSGLAAEPEAADAGPAARQFARLANVKRAWPWLAIGIGAYLVTLIVTFPARFVVSADPRRAVAGTVWNGEAVVDGAYRVQWRWAPWRSLASLAFAADVRMTGNGTDLAGSAIVSPGGTLLEGIAGSGDGGLLSAFGPDVPFLCQSALRINLGRLWLAETRSGATGEIVADAGTCASANGGQPHAIPALVTRIVPLPDGTTRIAIAPAETPRAPLFEGAIVAGRLRLAPTAAGIATLPFVQGLAIDEAM